MSQPIALATFRDSVERFADHISNDSDFVDAVDNAIGQIDEAVNLPGRAEFSMRVFMDGLTLPNVVTTVLSAAPFGIGTAVRTTDKVAKEVTGSLRPTWEALKKADDKLTDNGEGGVVELTGKISTVSTATKLLLDGVDITAGNLLDTARYLEEAIEEGFAPEGSRLEARIEASASFVGDVNNFHEGFAQVTMLVDDMVDLVGSTIGKIPTDIIDEAGELIDTVFGPISDAFTTIEDVLCTTITVTPRIPAVWIPNPIGWLPGEPDRIQVTPEIPAVKVNICDILDVITKQVAFVQNWVENTINDTLKLIGIDLFGAIDKLKDQLLTPFKPILDIVDGFADQIDDIRAIIDDALGAVGRFFEDLGKLLQDAVDQVVLFEAGQIGDEAPGSMDDVLLGSIYDGKQHRAVALAELATGEGKTANVEDGLFGRTGDDELMGLGGDDFLFGGEGEDTLEGGRDDDENYGGEGADTYVFAEDYGEDFVSDGSGPSTFVFDAGSEFSYSRSGDDLMIEAGRGTVRVDGFYEGDQRETTMIRIGTEEMRVNTAPENLEASATPVAEDAAIGTVVAQLSATDADGDALTYSLEDDADGLFAIEGDTIVVNGTLDFETAAEHMVTVVAEDGFGGETRETVAITVEDVFEPGLPPENLALSGGSLAGDAAEGTTVGTLSGTDPEGETLTWRLLDDAEGRVRLEGTTVVVATALAIETDQTLRIVAEAEDPLGNTTSAAFDVAVEGVAAEDLAPETLMLSGAVVAEDAEPGTEVGTLSAVDPEGQTVTYRLIDDADGRFVLDGATLLTADGFDFETADSHLIEVEATDPAGNAATGSFAVAVTDVAEEEAGTDPGNGDSGNGETEPPAARIVEGTPEDDFFEFDMPANRMVLGEEGRDTVSYELSRAEVEASVVDSGAVIAVPDGPADMLNDVERVELEDGTYLFDLRDEAAFTYRVYAASFGRTPDEGGLRHWDGQVEAGLSQRKLSEAFVASQEFADRFGEDPTAEEFIDALYTNILGRASDGSGRDFWVGQIEDGVDRADALIAFADSPENQDLNADNYDAGMWVL